MKIVIALVWLWAWPLAASSTQSDLAPPMESAQPASRPRHTAIKESVSSLTLVKASDGIAVIRFATGSLEKLRVNDVVGPTKAVVTEIGAGRIVLDEAFTGADGRPNRALIVIREGERGGTRHLQRSDEPRFTGTTLVPVAPAAPAVTKPPPKKP